MKNAVQGLSTLWRRLAVGLRAVPSRLRALPGFSKILLAAGIAVVVLGVGITWPVVESKTVDVPDLTGVSVVEAIELAGANSLSVESNDPLPSEELRQLTAITSQNPAPGERVFSGGTITFDYELVEVKVPRLAGLTLTGAKQRLEKLGLSTLESFARIVYSDSSTEVDGIPRPADPDSLNAAISELASLSQVDQNLVDLDGGAFVIGPHFGRSNWFVLAVNPAEGTMLRAGSEVAVTLALPLRHVPDATGVAGTEATKLLRQAGLKSGVSTPTWDGTLPADFKPDRAYLYSNYWSEDEQNFLRNLVGDPSFWPVVAQSMAPGTIALRWQTVRLQMLWPSATVPDLAQMSASQARTALHDAGLSWRDIAEGAEGIVRSQTIPAGTEVPMGMRVGANVAHEILFTVKSSASRGSITYTAPGQSTIQDVGGADLPWRKTWYPTTLPDPDNNGIIDAQLDAEDGWVSCEIIVDGQLVDKRTSSGKFAAVRCG